MMKGLLARTGRKPISSLAIAAGVCVLLLLIQGRGLLSERSIPEPLQGTWVTDARQMRDRYLKLTGGLVIFGLGQGREQVCPVDRVESEGTAGGGTRFTVHYREDDGGKRTLDFTFQAGSGGSIRLLNRPEVWRRSGGEVRI